MKASIVDLRYKMNDVVKALDRNEKVTVLYRGKVKGIIMPAVSEAKLKVAEHDFFGMHKDKRQSVLEELKSLRKGRYSDI